MKIQKSYIASSRKSGADAIRPDENLFKSLETIDNLRSGDIFPNHQATSRDRQIPYTTLHQANVSTAFTDAKIAAHELNGNLAAAGSIA